MVRVTNPIEKKLQKKVVPLVIVMWMNSQVKKGNLEKGVKMKNKYLKLFLKKVIPNFINKILNMGEL